MNPQKRALHIRLNTQSGRFKSMQQLQQVTFPDEKLPSLTNICKSIQGEDGTIFSINSILENRNKTSCKTQRHLTKTSFDQSERKDLKLLEQWTNNMAQQLSTQKYESIQEFYDKLEIIYTGAVSQLNTQLSVKCVDYGNLLDKIWKAYTGAVKQIIDKLSNANRKLEKDSLSETIKLHELYQKSLNDKHIKMQEAEISSKRNSEWAEKMSKENRHLRKKAKKYEQESHKNKDDLEMLKLQLKDTLQENEMMRLFSNQQIRKIQVRRDQTYEQIEQEFEHELFKAKKEIFDDFKKKFDYQTQQFEETYQRRVRELENQDDKADQDEMMIDDYQEILFRDQCVGNHITQSNQGTDTGDLKKYTESSTQTIQIKNKVNTSTTQTNQIQQMNQQSEANFSIIKRECVPRNKDEQTYLEMAQYPLSVFIEDFYELKIEKKELNKPTFLGILEEQIDKLKYRSTQICNIMKFKEDFILEDFDTVNSYVHSSYNLTTTLSHDFLAIIKDLKEELVRRKIQLFESQIDCKISNKSKQFTDKKFSTLSAKYQQILKQQTFILRQFKIVSKYIPQYQLDQLNRKGLKHKVFFEFQKNSSPKQQHVPHSPSLTHLPSFEKSNVFASQAPLEKLMPPIKTQQTLTLAPPSQQQRKSLGFMAEEDQLQIEQQNQQSAQALHHNSTLQQQQSKSSFPDMSNEDLETYSPMKPQINLFFPECAQEDTDTESDPEDVDIEAQIDPIKNVLTIEKKLFLNRQTSKASQVPIGVLLQEIQQFRRDKKEGLQKMITLNKQLIQFVGWCVKQNKFHSSFHQQLYDYISSENFSQPQNVWQMKLGRIVKSLIYYKKKSNYAKLFYDMMVGNLKFKRYLQILSGIQQRDLTENALMVQQSQFVDSLNNYIKVNIQKNATFIDFDNEMFNWLPQIMEQEIEELKQQKYNIVLEIFQDENQRLTQLQFRTLISEIEGQKQNINYLNLFNNEYDVEQSGIQYMTFNRFVQVCEEYKLLQLLDKYIDTNNIQYFIDLELWKNREIDLKLMLIRSHNYDGAEKDFFNRMFKLQVKQRIILGRYLERRAKEVLLETYTEECLAPHMLYLNKNEIIKDYN